VFLLVKTLKKTESNATPIFKMALKAVSKNNDNESVLIEGHKLLDEALKSGATPEMIFIETPAALREKTDLNPISYQVSRAMLRELSSVQTPAEIIAFVKLPTPVDVATALQNSRFVLVLDRLQDPGNIGTIIRTGEAMGIDLLVMLEGCCSRRNHKVVRAAMGSCFRLPIIDKVPFEQLLPLLRLHGFHSICADMNGQPLPSFRFPPRCSLFLGQEGRGLDEEILKECNTRLAIPMQGQVESLNVATSAAICLYEWAHPRSAG